METWVIILILLVIILCVIFFWYNTNSKLEIKDERLSSAIPAGCIPINDFLQPQFTAILPSLNASLIDKNISTTSPINITSGPFQIAQLNFTNDSYTCPATGKSRLSADITLSNIPNSSQPFIVQLFAPVVFNTISASGTITIDLIGKDISQVMLSNLTFSGDGPNGAAGLIAIINNSAFGFLNNITMVFNNLLSSSVQVRSSQRS
jgi:hypothetical protein